MVDTQTLEHEALEEICATCPIVKKETGEVLEFYLDAYSTVEMYFINRGEYEGMEQKTHNIAMSLLRDYIWFDDKSFGGYDQLQ